MERLDDSRTHERRTSTSEPFTTFIYFVKADAHMPPYRPYVQHLTASEPTGESSDLSTQLIVEALVKVELLHVVEA